MTTTVILPIDNSDAGTLARQLLRRGCRVAVTGSDVGALLDAVRGYGTGRAVALVGDVHDPADVTRMHSAAEQSLGPVDVVIPAETPTGTGELASVHPLPSRAAGRRSTHMGVHGAVA